MGSNMSVTLKQIEEAILDSTGRPDSGVIRDNLAAMAAGVLGVVDPSAVAKPAKESKIENKTQETRVITAEETR